MMTLQKILAELSEDHYPHGTQVQAELALAEESDTWWGCYRHCLMQVWSGIDSLVDDRLAFEEMRADAADAHSEYCASPPSARKEYLSVKAQTIRYKMRRLAMHQSAKAEKLALFIRYAMGFREQGVHKGDLLREESERWSKRDGPESLRGMRNATKINIIEEMLRPEFLERAPRLSGQDVLEAINNGTPLIGPGSSADAQTRPRIGDDSSNRASGRRQPVPN